MRDASGRGGRDRIRTGGVTLVNGLAGTAPSTPWIPCLHFPAINWPSVHQGRSLRCPKTGIRAEWRIELWGRVDPFSPPLYHDDLHQATCKAAESRWEQREQRSPVPEAAARREEALEAHGDGGRRLRGRAIGAQPGGFLQNLMPRQPAAKGKARNRAKKARRGELFPLSAQPKKQRQHDCKQECNKSPAARRPVVLRRSSSYHFQVTPVRIPVDYPT